MNHDEPTVRNGIFAGLTIDELFTLGTKLDNVSISCEDEGTASELGELADFVLWELARLTYKR